MSKVLDLHGVRHAEVDILVENFVLLEEFPLTIITGNSEKMASLVKNVLVRHNIKYERWDNSTWKILCTYN